MVLVGVYYLLCVKYKSMCVYVYKYHYKQQFVNPIHIILYLKYLVLGLGDMSKNVYLCIFWLICGMGIYLGILCFN